MAEFAAGRTDIRKPVNKKYGTGSYFREEVEKPPALMKIPRRFYRFGIHREVFRKKLRALPAPPRLIGVTGIMTYWCRGVRETVSILKESFPGVPVALGGIYPTLIPGHARRESGADIIFEGTATIPNILTLLRGAGIHPPRPPKEGEGGLKIFFPYPEPPYGIVSTSEGCPRHCTYCASSFLRPRFVGYDPEDVMGALRALSSRGITDIAFYDDDLLHGASRRLLPLLGRVMEELPGLRLHAPNGLFLAHVDEGVARVLFRAGFRTLRFGFETADAELGRRTGFKIDRARFRRRIRTVLEAGFTADQIGVYVMAGLPGQTARNVEESLRFVRDCGMKANLAEFSPVPRTPEFENALRESSVDFSADPELQNNSVLPLRSPVFTVDVLSRLKNLCYDRRSG